MTIFKLLLVKYDNMATARNMYAASHVTALTNEQKQVGVLRFLCT